MKVVGNMPDARIEQAVQFHKQQIFPRDRLPDEEREQNKSEAGDPASDRGRKSLTERMQAHATQLKKQKEHITLQKDSGDEGSTAKKLQTEKDEFLPSTQIEKQTQDGAEDLHGPFTQSVKKQAFAPREDMVLTTGESHTEEAEKTEEGRQCTVDTGSEKKTYYHRGQFQELMMDTWREIADQRKPSESKPSDQEQEEQTTCRNGSSTMPEKNLNIKNNLMVLAAQANAQSLRQKSGEERDSDTGITNPENDDGKSTNSEYSGISPSGKFREKDKTSKDRSDYGYRPYYLKDERESTSWLPEDKDGLRNTETKKSIVVTNDRSVVTIDAERGRNQREANAVLPCAEGSDRGRSDVSKHLLSDLISQDRNIRDRTLQTVTYDAVHGKRAALDALGMLISINECDDRILNLDREDRKCLFKNATEAFINARERFNSEDYKALVKSLGIYECRNTSETFLEKEAQKGNSELLDILRKAARENVDNNTNIVNVLAQAGPHLKSEDYKLIACVGLGSPLGNNALECIKNGAREGNINVINILRETLTEKQGNTGLRWEQKTAAEILANHPEHIRPQEIIHLKRLAVQKDYSSASGKAFNAIAAAATVKPPVEGAVDAFVYVMNHVRNKKEYNHSIIITSECVTKAFNASAEYESARIKLAPYVLENSNNEASLIAAVKTLEKCAAQGDREAIKVIVNTAKERKGYYGLEKVRECAEQVIDRIASNGMAAEVADSIIASNDQEALYMLGIAAKHLERDDPMLVKVRAALRAGLSKNSIGDRTIYEGAARGMSEIADRLQPEDINALERKLDTVSALALGKAADHMVPEERARLRERLRNRINNGDYRAIATLRAMAPYLEKEDIASISRERLVLGREGRKEAANTFADVIAKSGNDSVRILAARELQKCDKADIEDRSEQIQSSYIASSGDQSLRREVPGISPVTISSSGSNARDAYIDMASQLSTSVIKHSIDRLADERGESGRIQFELGISKSVRFAEIGAFLKTGIECSKSDSGSICLGVDYEAAVKAGIDFKLIKLHVEAGTAGKLTLRFQNSTHAANFILDMLQQIDRKMPNVAIFMFDRAVVPSYPRPTVVVETGAVAGIGISTGDDKNRNRRFNFDGSFHINSSTQRFILPDRTVVNGSYTKTSGSTNLKIPVDRNDSIEAHFEGFWTEIQGDPLPANNGCYRGGAVELNLSDIMKMIPDKLRHNISDKLQQAIPEKLKKVLAEVAEKIRIPIKDIDRFMKSVVEGIVKLRLNGDASTESGRNTKLVLSFQQVQGADNGQTVWRTQYFRIFIKTEYEVKSGIETPAAEVEARFNASKSELIHEEKYDETYLQTIYSNKSEWEEFKRSNPDFLITVMENGKQVQKNLEQLEVRWKRSSEIMAKEDKNLVKTADWIANTADDLIVNAGKEKNILIMMGQYMGRPVMLQKLVNLLADRGISLEHLLDKVDNKENHNKLISMVRHTNQFKILVKNNYKVTREY